MDGFIKQAADTARPLIFDRMSVLADPIRCRLLLVLEGHELTVSELCTVLQLPQSTVSRHLKVLSDGGWVFARREGTSRRYSMIGDDLETEAERLWGLVREQLATSPATQQDRRRLDGVLAERRSRSQEFFSSAEQWAQLRREMFGQRFDLLALPGLLDPLWTVADLGAGTGQMAASLAPFVAKVIAVDDSEAMLDAARARLADLGNVDLRPGRLEALPLLDAEADAATLILVLHHVAEPGEALEETWRTLRPGGRVLVVDMLPHEHEEYLQQMGHVWLGFASEQIERWLGAAGFEAARVRPLPADPEAKGPTLFAATARKPLDGKPASTKSQSVN
jgi:ubiquinone/menaquinone biosynthesis C-methylase UbiE